MKLKSRLLYKDIILNLVSMYFLSYEYKLLISTFFIEIIDFFSLRFLTYISPKPFSPYIK